MAERSRQMKVSELREQAIESLNQTPYIDIETDGGEVFRVWHPLLVDDEAQARIDRFNAQEDLDKDEDGSPVWPARINGKLAEPGAVRSARAILGPHVHKAFVKAGGHSHDVQLAWNEMVRMFEEDDTVLGDPARVEFEDPKSE
jgi:hypothetical protein